jgi:hypothetical protein
MHPNPVSRWHLLVRSVPVAIAVVALKLVLDATLGGDHGFGYLEYNSDLNVIFTGVVFIMSIVLGGTITDFKEAEKLPGEIACQLEIFEDWMTECIVQNRAKAAGKQQAYTGPDEGRALGTVLSVTDELLAWFRSKDKRSESLFPAVKRLDAQVKELSVTDANGITVRIYGDLNALRKAVSRAWTIARTDFLGSAYALFEFFIAVIIGLLLVCKFKSAVTAGVVTGFLSLTYWYLYRLIRDIDNPFGYHDGQNEVSLHLLERYRTRLADRLATLPEGAR